MTRYFPLPTTPPLTALVRMLSIIALCEALLMSLRHTFVSLKLLGAATTRFALLKCVPLSPMAPHLNPNACLVPDRTAPLAQHFFHLCLKKLRLYIKQIGKFSSLLSWYHIGSRKIYRSCSTCFLALKYLNCVAYRSYIKASWPPLF